MRPPQRRRSGRVLVLILAGLALAALAGFGFYWLRSRHISLTMPDPAAIHALIASWGALAPLCAVLLMVVHSFLPLPAEIVALANGMAFGPVAGIAITWTGAMLGAILSFALARLFGERLIRPLLPRRRRHRPLPGSATGLLLARLIPLISFNLVNYGAGLLTVGWWTFLWTTGLGILPLTIAMVLIGNRLSTTPLWMWGAVAAGAGLLALLWHLARARRRKRG